MDRIYTLLVRGPNLTNEELDLLRTTYEELGQTQVLEAATKKKILPFAARTLAECGLDAAFWQEYLQAFRVRNTKILRCLNEAYCVLQQHDVKKMFVSENFAALLSANADIGLFASGDVDNYADPCEKEKIYHAFESLGFTRKERYAGLRLIAAEFFPPKDANVPAGFYISVDFYPLARLKLPCFIEADEFVDWAQLTCYADTKIVLPPPTALMYICLLHISLHSFSRAPDIRLYIDPLNMSKTQVDYYKIEKWCIHDRTQIRVSAAAELSNKLMKSQIPQSIVQLSERRHCIERIVFDSAKNELNYEPKGLEVLRIEALCDDRGFLHGLQSIFFPDKKWMKSVYGSNNLVAFLKHFVRTI